MPTITKASALTRVTTHFKDRRTDASRLGTAQDLAYLITTGMSYRDIVADVTTRDGETTISTKTISLYVNALKDAGDDATPETFGAAYRERHHASRTPKPKAAKAAKDDAATPGNDETAAVTVTNAETALQAFAALLTTVDTLPARDRQRVIASMTRTLSRRYTKAA